MTNSDTKVDSSPPSTSNLPPGMILGPDGKPCKICTAFRNWTPRTGNANSAKDKSKSSAFTSTAAVMGALATGSYVAESASQTNKRPSDCPPDSEELGRATWAFLHTTAAYYPERPTPTQRANMIMLLRSLPVLYPCSTCADDFGERIKVHPPDVGSRERLSRWLCERHNEVNERLGKNTFDCAKTDERWKDGPPNGSCD
jgi:FAD-linked sulfhydryl oxidase